MVKTNNKDETVEPSASTNKRKKNLILAGAITGGVLVLGTAFAAGAALGQVADGHRGGGDFATEQSSGPGHFGPRGGHGMSDGEYNDDQAEQGPGDGEYNDDQAEPGDGDGDGEYNDDQAEQGPGDGEYNDGSTTPAPTTTP